MLQVNSSGWINTASGKKVYPLNPRVEDFVIEDQATSLAHTNRYLGNSSRPWSVAQHELALYYLVNLHMRDTKDFDKYAPAWALVHDNGEPYMGDFPYPLKQLPEFKFILDLEAVYENLIGLWLNIGPMPAIVRQLDKAICGLEAPMIFDKLHPDWLPELGPAPWAPATGSLTLGYMHQLSALPPPSVKALYLRTFKSLFRAAPELYTPEHYTPEL